MAQENRSPKVLQNPPHQAKTEAPQAAAVKKQRNKRAVITDHFRPASDDKIATEKFDKALAESEKAWQHIVKTFNAAGIRVGTTFNVPENSSDTEKGSFTADLLAYPIATVLQLAQSRQHNKLMDGYSEPSEQVLPTVREIDAELIKGVWSQRGEGTPRYTLLERAVSELYGKSLEEAAEALEAAGISKVTDFENPGPIKVRMGEIQQRDAAARTAKAKESAKNVALPKLF